MIIARKRTKSHFMVSAGNVEHPTSNVQRRTQNPVVRNWMLGVQRSAFSSLEIVLDEIENPQNGDLLSGRLFFSGKEAVPEPADRALFLVTPRVMTIQAIKFLRNNFQSAKQCHQRRRHELSRHLRIFN